MHSGHLAAVLALSMLWTTGYAEADYSASSSALTSSRFPLLSTDSGATLSHKPPAPLSTSSFDIGFDISATRLTQPQAYQLTDNGGDALYPSRLHAHKNLPFGFGIGASYGMVPGSDLRVVGAEARYSLVPDSMVLPTIGLRASYSTLRGSDRLEMNTRGIDLSLSKGFSLVTPYAGIGSVWMDSDSQEGMGLARERFHHDKYFIGANFHLRLMNLAVEADRTGDTTHYQARFGWSW